MPCRGPDLYEEQYHILSQTIPLLCEACNLLEDAHLLNKASPELRNWYKDHSAKEEDRVRYEAALKLSERERRLLNIDLSDLKNRAERKCTG
jgi:hypothetical protein